MLEACGAAHTCPAVIVWHQFQGYMQLHCSTCSAWIHTDSQWTVPRQSSPWRGSQAAQRWWRWKLTACSKPAHHLAPQVSPEASKASKPAAGQKKMMSIQTEFSPRFSTEFPYPSFQQGMKLSEGRSASQRTSGRQGGKDLPITPVTLQVRSPFFTFSGKNQYILHLIWKREIPQNHIFFTPVYI